MRLKVETDAVAETQHLEPCAFDKDGVTSFRSLCIQGGDIITGTRLIIINNLLFD